MENIFEFIPSLKLVYLVLIILVMIIINIVLNKKQIANNYKYLVNGIVLVGFGLLINYFKDIVEGIFNLNYLSVKLYIITLIIINIIMMITIQKRFSLIYKIINYLLFGLTSLILISNIIIIGGTKLELITPKFNNYTVKLINISIVIFIIYLTILSIIYIIRNLIRKETVDKEIVNKINFKDIILKQINTIINKTKPPKEEKDLISESVPRILSLNELLSLPNKELFSINGVNCSIIFEDSIPDNILKNYHILLEDINAKMVNGYTLEENKMLKSICHKLQNTNLNDLNLKDISILNKVTPDEYDLLKKVCNK